VKDSITASLQVATLAASALARLSPFLDMSPGMGQVIDHCSYLMNENLDFVADELLSSIPGIPGPINGKSHPGISSLSGFSSAQPPGASVVPERAEEVSDYQEPQKSDWEPSSEQELSKCKALLLEVLRRAAHDWVLYRRHRKMDKRELARDAYIWLFKENERHPYRRERLTALFPGRNGRSATRGARIITSFQAICENLDLDPKVVRAHVKKMNARSIIASGRPPQQRYPVRELEEMAECSLQIKVDLDEDPNSENYISQYESVGAVPTPTVVYLGLREPPVEVSSPEGDFVVNR
jgi:hypothetical protein